MFSGFEVIPAIDIEGGDVVQLVGGKRDTRTPYGNPTQMAAHWVDEGAQTLHLVDLDGAFDGERKNAGLIEEIVRTVDVPVQLGGGIRRVDDALSLLDTGITRVILGTIAIEEPEVVTEISEVYADGVMVSLDSRDGEVVIAGWTEGTGLDPAEAAVTYEELGAAAILFTNVDVEGRLAGIEGDPVREVVAAVDIPVVASGGVSSVQDLVALRETGADAVVVGTALYEGRFSLAAAMTAVQ